MSVGADKLARFTRLAVIAIWLCVIVGCGAFAVLATPILTQFSHFIPRTDIDADLLDDLYSSVAARMVLIAIEGDSEEARAAVSNRLRDALKTSDSFVRVLNGPSSLSTDDMRQLYAYRYLLSPTVSSDRFTVDGLRSGLQQRLAELSSPLSPISKQYLPGDPTGELRSVLSVFQGGIQQPETRFGVWMSPNGKRALLIAETQVSGFDAKAQRPVVDSIRQAFVNAKGESQVTLLLSGPGVLATLSEQTIRTEATLLSFGSLAAIIALLVYAYRSLRVILLSPLPLLSAVIVAIAVVGILYGGIQGLVLGFGATLMGVTVDYPVHLFSHLRRQERVADTMRRLWPTLRLCVISTTIGYVAMISTSLTGLAELGIFSMVGLLTAAAVTRWVLPAILPERWAPPELVGLALIRRLMQHRRVPCWPIFAAGACLLAVMATVIALKPPGWQTDLTALSPIPADILAQDGKLRADLHAPEVGQVLFIRALTPDAVILRSEELAGKLQQLVAAGSLTGFDAPSLYLPSQAVQRARRAALPDASTLRANLAQATAGLPFRLDAFEPFLRAVEAARSARFLGLEDLRHTPLGLRIESLLYPSEGGWTGMITLSGVRNPQQLVTSIDALGYANVTYLDFRATTTRLMTDFRDQAISRLYLGALLLVALLVVGVRSWQRTLVVLLPLTLAVLLDLCVLALRGEPLTLFHLVSLLLVVGLGIDYGLFFSSTADDTEEQSRTLHALLLCSSSTAAGFGMLCFSSLPVLKAIGQTVTVGVIAAYVFAAIIARPWAISQLPARGGSH